VLEQAERLSEAWTGLRATLVNYKIEYLNSIHANDLKIILLSTLRIENLANQVLGPVSFTVGDGECVCLSGASGAGKTLLLRAIVDLDPHAGEVFLDGVPCEHFLPPEWRRNVGMLPAESQWWGTVVGEHFSHVVSVEALAALGFDPGILGWEVSCLSSGERQRLALLRLLSQRPGVLLLDEPTANLDPVNVRRAEALLNRYRIAHRAAVIWVSHDSDQIRRVAERHFRITNRLLTEEPMVWATSSP
jgi:ABC-type uncharacterized transport system, ATPase component